MEVMVGSSFKIGMKAYVRNHGGVSAQDKAVPAALFLVDESEHGGSQVGLSSGIGLRMMINKSSEELSEDSSSSIGESSENEEEVQDEAVSFEGGVLDSFSSCLEDSLPIKRGLSNHYVGKSKSFGNLRAARNIKAKDLEKMENPYNKRRRLLIANKRRERSLSASQFYTWQNPNSMPLLALQEPNEEKHNDDDDDDEDGAERTVNLFQKRKMMMKKNKRDLMAQTRSCFCLGSLQEKDDDENSGNGDHE